ncbi:uncharacterized protein LOC135171764 isoform X3 [Diachasmimorpha longicaudata]
MLSLQVIIKNCANGSTQELHLLLKSVAAPEIRRPLVDKLGTFEKEMFMYSTIFPMYEELEIQSNLMIKDCLRIIPLYYGEFMKILSYNPLRCDGVMMFDNMQSAGYYSVSKAVGCNLHHAVLATITMAKFHALGMGTKERQPQYFERMKAAAKVFDVESPEMWEKLFEEMLNDITSNPKLKRYHEVCRRAFNQNMVENWKIVPSEPWSTIIHGNYWVKNMLFRSSRIITPARMILLDYQTYLFASPMRELAFFVNAGLDLDTMDYVDELIDLYYEILIKHLKLLHCDTEPYTRESFDRAMANDAYEEFPHCVDTIKIKTDDYLNKINYQKRLRKMIRTYSKKHWFKRVE